MTGSDLRACRKALGLKQRELGALLFTGPSEICRLEASAELRVDGLRRPLFAALHVWCSNNDAAAAQTLGRRISELLAIAGPLPALSALLNRLV